MKLKPTNNELKRFWKWCGLWYEQPYWLSESCQEGECAFYGEYYKELLGSVTLNNLFKYAVPKSPDYNPDVRLIQSITFSCDECFIIDIEGIEHFGESKDPALALFWAIYDMIV